MRESLLGRTTQEKDLGVTFSADMKVSEQCGIAASKGNQILGLIRRTIMYKEKQLIVTLYKAIVRPHLECCIQAWRLYRKKDIDKLERIQRRATKNQTLSQTVVTNTGAPQGCVSSPILYILYTNDCTSSSTNNYIIKFSDDSAILSLLHADSDISMYTSEIESFVHWCDNNHLKLNVSNTQEMIFDAKCIVIHACCYPW